MGTLIEVFLALPCLEGLVLDVGKNVKQSGVALEALNSKEVLIGLLYFECFAYKSDDQR